MTDIQLNAKGKVVKSCQEKWALLQIRVMVIENNGGVVDCDYLKQYVEHPEDHAISTMELVEDHLDRYLRSTAGTIKGIVAEMPDVR